MKRQRVEIRLKPATRRKMKEVVAARGSSVSELGRVLIERSYEQEVAKARLTAERIGAMEVEDAPESNELKRQFAEAHRVGWAIANLAVASRPVGLYNRLRAKRKQRKEAALYR